MTSMLYDLLIGPFAEFEFMRRALVGVIAIALGGGPVGVFLMLRRMSLTGDAMAHAILPGAAVGLSRRRPVAAGHDASAASRPASSWRCWPASSSRVHGAEGGCVACRLLPDVAGARRHHRVAARLQRRSAARAVRHRAGARRRRAAAARRRSRPSRSWRWPLLYRPLVLECVDPVFLRSVSRAGTPTHLVFLGLVVLNLVGGFQALGTLLAVGMMMLPAAAARFWSARHHRA